MTGADWARLETVFHDALDHRPESREVFLRTVCGGDIALAAEARRLLAEHERAGAFLRTNEAARHGAGAGPDSTRGRRVGTYTIERVIAAGGMGTVYEAVQDQPRRTVALKIVRAGLASAWALRRFEHEAEILARLHHAGIAQVFEAGTFDDGSGPVPFFAMELIAGARSLTAHAAEHALDLPARLHIFLKVCDAVQHAHTCAVIHRDLKPGNILVGDSGEPKVIDFGVARVVDDQNRVTVVTDARAIVGTLGYMSPEQCEPGAQADARSDVYSLGVVLYELLCDRPPYDVHDTPIAEATRIIRERPPRRLSSVSRALRGDLETVILKCLEKAPDRRYQSVADFAADLRRVLNHEPIHARPASAVYHARMFARRNRVLVGAGLVVLLSLIAGGTLSAVSAVRAGREARRAQRVNEFLLGAFSSANPFVPTSIAPDVIAGGHEPWADWRQNPWPFAGRPGEAARAADILRAAGDRLESAFPDDPLARARLADAMGWTLFRLREFKDAERLLRAAVALRTQRLGAGDDDTIRAGLHLAELLDSQGQREEAASILERSLDECRRRHGPDDARTLRIERMAASDLYDIAGRYGDAVAILDRTLNDADARGTGDLPDVLEHRAYAAWLRARNGDIAGAEPSARRAVEKLRSRAGPADIRTAVAYDTLAYTLWRKSGVSDEAESLARDALAARARAFGERSLQTAAAHLRLADGLLSASKWAPAADEYLAAADTFALLLGPEDFETLRAKGNAGRSLVAGATDPARAERIVTEASDALERLLGRSDGYVLSYRAPAAEAAGLQGRAGEAAERYDRLVADARAAPSSATRALLPGLLVRAGAWYITAGLPGAARERLLEALDLSTSNPNRQGEIRALLKKAADLDADNAQPAPPPALETPAQGPGVPGRRFGA